MGLKLLFLLLLAAAMVASEAQSLPGCLQKCGNVNIPYPFGVGDNCSLEESFNLTCNDSKLLYRNIEISNISLEGHMDISMFVSKICYNESGVDLDLSDSSLTTDAFTISSTANKFINVGCDTFGYLNSFRAGHNYSTGCLSRCGTLPKTENINGTCSGIGCCQVDIPPRMRNISFQSYSFTNHTKVLGFNNCSYAFVAKLGWFNFSLDYLNHLPFEMAPLVVDWNVQNPNVTCENALTARKLPCTPNSHCYDPEDGSGYRCRCKPGFRGNPYHPDGCSIDIDECNESTHNCISIHNCRNTIGSFHCYCPHGYSGNGTKEEGCQAPLSKIPLKMVLLGASAGLVALYLGVSWLYLVYQKRKLIKQKDKFFRQNGGFILQQRLSVKEASSQTAKIFTAEELKKATNNYHDNLIIGTGGYGTVYKGFLADNKIVAIKKSKLVDQNQVEQFINEIVVLSQINHRNVVKLLGCCLETEVPLLVYEFVNNGTLFDYVRYKSKASNVSWETRLRIATEAAGALSYLHSAASIPIIHRDVKSSNILLDETYTVKVSDFGASRLVPLDRTELVTMVQGTLGYLDPEYMQTNQLTEKSDVYSFGVVLVELLTGKKAFSFDRPENERCLAMHFLSSLDRGQLFQVLEVGIVNNENKEMLKEVAILAERCLRLRGDERPGMKEVAMEIERIRMKGKHSLVNKEFEGNLVNGWETSTISEWGDSINYRKTGWDNITDVVRIDLDDGR